MPFASHVLFLSGRGGSVASSPGDLVAAHPWPVPLLAPELDEAWCVQPFAQQLSQVQGWLEGAGLAVGYSYGAWLLLAAAEERARGVAEPLPTEPGLLLLSPILGELGQLRGLLQRAPRAVRLRTSLGLGEAEPEGWLGGVRFLFGDDDPLVRPAEVARLAGRGLEVECVAAGHDLAEPAGRRAVVRCLERAGREIRTAR